MSVLRTRFARKPSGQLQFDFRSFRSTFQTFGHEARSYFYLYWPVVWIDIDILRTAKRAGHIPR